ncbi:T-cell ecto-ADP-ribosyltransferase 2-like [Acomys russatus]|uniref:T-cell ecto-ADP-ribosyltransferase 2-like n=1 Tax=Acomys russatus TaxID=60746 RepID=UPI0021E25284|nr:T-cell ecto-ADP-ribosyltransferase 2-like [Acomys russatus]
MTPKFHVLLLAWWLTQQVTGLTSLNMPSSFQLDMAPNAFDDQYEGCVEDMEEKAPRLLQEDFNMNKQLKSEWEKAEQQWKKIKTTVSYPKGFHDFHGTALVAYTGAIYKDFNEAVREFKKKSSKFHYRAFHYYLTRALQLLNNQNCYTVYRGSQTKFHYSGKGPVRFGQLTSSSFTKKVALENYGGARGTLLTIKTCLGVSIKTFSYSPGEEEVLIPGYEVYYRISPIGEGNKEMYLGFPKREKSNFNCFYSGSTDSSHFSGSGCGSES